jgi:hypothetical protein
MLFTYRHFEQNGKITDIVVGIYSGFVSSLIVSIFVYRLTKYLDFKSKKRIASSILQQMHPILTYHFDILTIATKNILTPHTGPGATSKHFSFKNIEYVFKPSLLTIRKTNEDSYLFYFDTLNSFTTILSSLADKIDPEVFPDMHKNILELTSTNILMGKDLQTNLHSIKYDNEALYKSTLSFIRNSRDEDPPLFKYANIYNGVILAYQFVRAVYTISLQIKTDWQDCIGINNASECLYFEKRQHAND